MSEVLQALRGAAKDLLDGGKVGVVIGYGSGSLPDRVRPLLITRGEEADLLVWNDRCTYNLANLLTKPELAEYEAKAVVVTPTGARAVRALLQEEQITPDRVVTIGVGPEEDLPDFVNVRLVTRDGPKKPVNGEIERHVQELRGLEPADRWTFWQAEFEKCVRCYACRQHCPMCYCTRCIAEKSRPDWIEKSAHPRGNLSWHIIRAFHLAGRCILCGQCESVCPVDIPLLLLNFRMAESVKKHYSYEAGAKAEGKPPLTEYSQDDVEDFIR